MVSSNGVSLSEDGNQVYLACLMQGQRLGVAYYDASACHLYGLEACEDALGDNFPCLQLLKFQVEPTIIYGSTRADEQFLTALQAPVYEDGQEFDVKLVKNSTFSYELAKHRLAYVTWSTMPEDLTDKQRIQMLMSMINFDNSVQVRAMGALLAILQQEMILDHAPDGDDDGSLTPLQIGEISQLSMYMGGDGYLTLDATTYDALQIFQTEKHPSSMGIGNSKEGFSVFGIMNKCVTQAGRRMLRLWFLRPIVSLEMIQDRYSTIDYLKELPDLMRQLQEILKHIKDVPKLLHKLSSANLLFTKKDWQQLQESLVHLLHIRELCHMAVGQQQEYTNLTQLRVIQKVFENINEDIKYVAELITRVLDFDQTCGETKETLVALGICEELDELKHLYEGLSDFLQKVAAAELDQWPDNVSRLCKEQHATIEYIPQVGFLLRVEGVRDLFHNLESQPGVKFSFEGNDVLGRGTFFQTPKTKELDEVLGDILHKIIDMESAVILDLEERILRYSASLQKAAAAASEIDCLVSLACCAREYRYKRPTLTRSNVINIKNGRHLLQEMTVDTFVPNSTDIGSEGRVCVITGPNYSGKSIYIKQVAIIVFLAHIGSFVPADEATIGITDRIFTRVASRESTSAAQSSFMIDLKQMSTMLRHATPRSLCLVDEFGKGTVTADGFGLLCATLHHVAALPAPPKVLLCTHFCEVMNSPNIGGIAFHTMSVLEPSDSNRPTKDRKQKLLEDLVFLYRLVPGKAVESYGVHCAQLAGVPQEIVSRAQDVCGALKEGREVDRLESKGVHEKDNNFKALVEKLLAFDCAEGNVPAFLESIFTPAT